MLCFTSCMAPDMESMCRDVAAYAADRLGVRTAYVGDVAWPERERRFRAGMVDVVWICGLPYVWDWAGTDDDACLLAAPVMRGARYGGRAVYYSDIVVRRDSAYRAFGDLRGRRFAYNEPRSHSGYNIVRHHLATLGVRSGYFEAALESGSHQASLAWIVEGWVDASAIDSTVLELELERDPALAERVVSICSLGPSPMPPWLVRRALSPGLRDALQALFLTLHEDPAGRRILDGCRIERFVTVDDAHYDPIRAMAAEAAGVRL